MTRHLAFFLSSLAGGGVERSTLNLAGALAERGNRVDLVVCRPRGPLLDRLPGGLRLVPLVPVPGIPARLRVLRADPGNAAALLRPVLLPLKASSKTRFVPALADYLRREQPDVLVSAMTHPNLAALWARRLAGARTRVVVSERNTLSSYVAHFGRRWRWRYLAPLVGRVYRYADAIVAVADGVAEDLAATAGLPRESIRTIHNPVVDDTLEARAAAALEDPWFEPGAPPVVLAAGRLRANKDFPTLLRAFARARASRELRLVVLGEGEEREALEALARELGAAPDVAFRGWVENPFAYMSRAGVFVLSSAWEGLPGVLIQAMACGCPVVSTDCPGGSAEILERGALGPLVPVGDALALAGAIRSALEKPVERSRLRARAGDFSVEKAVERYAQLVAEL